ncbi:MAG: SDR family NAD(P)-dependent oxidoreductase, partial [Solirubrobacterales bacterium]|nr:SDR family NAD(P)-dependent oxidoreductase [Solirubrobacterales bacterium]
MSASEPRRVLLFGGTSEIGLAIVRRLAVDGPVRAFLLGRDRDGLARAAASLGPDTEYDLIDADAVDAHEATVDGAFERSGGFDVVVLAVGVLGAQAGLDADRSTAIEVMRVNFVGAGSLLLAAMAALRRQGSGALILLSTVAG